MSGEALTYAQLQVMLGAMEEHEAGGELAEEMRLIQQDLVPPFINLINRVGAGSKSNFSPTTFSRAMN